MMDFPKISIVTPSFNQGQFLERTIRSVLDQKYPNLEYFVIDGGSTDNSVEIIKKYEKQLTHWVSEPDKGLYNAVNKGFRMSTGEIMAWINSDDVYFKNAFFIVAEIFKNAEVLWLTSNYAYVNEDDSLVFTQTIKGFNKFDFFLNNIKWIQQESTFWRKDLWEKAGGRLDENYSLAADYELWCRFFQHEKLYHVSTCLSGFRVRNANQKSKENLQDYMDQVYSLRSNYFLSFKNNADLNRLKLLEKMMRRIPFSKYFLLQRYKAIRNSVYAMPPSFKFDRTQYKFIVES